MSPRRSSSIRTKLLFVIASIKLKLQNSYSCCCGCSAGDRRHSKWHKVMVRAATVLEIKVTSPRERAGQVWKMKWNSSSSFFCVTHNGDKHLLAVGDFIFSIPGHPSHCWRRKSERKRETAGKCGNKRREEWKCFLSTFSAEYSCATLILVTSARSYFFCESRQFLSFFSRFFFIFFLVLWKHRKRRILNAGEKCAGYTELALCECDESPTTTWNLCERGQVNTLSKLHTHGLTTAGERSEREVRQATTKLRKRQRRCWRCSRRKLVPFPQQIN